MSETSPILSDLKVFSVSLPQARETGCYLDNVIDERVSEHPVQSDAVALHQVLKDKYTHVGHSVHVRTSVTCIPRH